MIASPFIPVQWGGLYHPWPCFRCWRCLKVWHLPRNYERDGLELHAAEAGRAGWLIHANARNECPDCRPSNSACQEQK